MFINFKNLKTKINKRNNLLDMLALLLQHYLEIIMQENILQYCIDFFLAICKV